MRLTRQGWTKTIPAVVLLLITLTLFLPLAEIQAQIPVRVSDSITSDESTRDYWPTNGWRNRTPGQQGMSATILNDMIDFIEEQEYPIDSILIIKNGYSVLEEYPGDNFRNYSLKLLHSVTKSFASILIGIALQQGLLDNVSQSVLGFFPEYDFANPDPRKDRITIEHLLTMTPGYDWDEWSDPYEYPGNNSLDAVQYVLDRSMVYEPGAHWSYNGGASVLLGAIVQQVYGESTRNVARDHLFTPLGIDHFFLYTAPGGWYNTQGGLNLRTNALAKLGFLYLNNGTWNGTQIVPADYVANSSTPIEHLNPLGPQFGYGWHWWLRSDLGVYFAYGRHGQKIMVSPEHDMVVVFTASVGDDEYDYILRSISVGPDSEFSSNLLLEALTDLAILFTATAVISIIIVKRERKN
ncbi:MAG: serine hydrolase domain-containing protein [Candidatus Thorarchaeota archaeon]|jgi:CubicO group peptidase (beta-lactamase class C family)